MSYLNTLKIYLRGREKKIVKFTEKFSLLTISLIDLHCTPYIIMTVEQIMQQKKLNKISVELLGGGINVIKNNYIKFPRLAIFIHFRTICIFFMFSEWDGSNPSNRGMFF